MSEETAPYGPTIKRIRTHHLHEMKQRGERFSMLTSYDMLTAQIFDEAGIEILLVGDSASNNVLGNATSLPITVDELIPLTRAVSGAVERAMVVGDLPFGSYQASPEQAYLTAVRFMKEGGAHAVKLEGGVEMAPQIERMAQRRHPGDGPHRLHPAVRARARRLPGTGSWRHGRAGAARRGGGPGRGRVRRRHGDGPRRRRRGGHRKLQISTIGIGAGKECDGQVLVWQDAFGLRTGRMPRFVKQYADLRSVLLDAARAYDSEVKTGEFPGPDHTF